VTSRKYLRIGLLAAVVLLFLLPSVATLYIDWLWFLEVAQEQVFLRTLNTRLLLGTATFAVVFGVLVANIRMARSGLRKRDFTVFGPQGPQTIAIDMRRLLHMC
jgi:uncharacterized membrane protein (UPF0182 family)